MEQRHRKRKTTIYMVYFQKILLYGAHAHALRPRKAKYKQLK